jgi:hypothetical protein
VEGELDGILRELYATLRRNRHSLELLDRCGQDHPELSEALQRDVRETTQHRIAHYLERRADDDVLRAVPHPFLRARIALETLVTWAVHIGRDPIPQSFDPKQVEDEVVAFVRQALVGPGGTVGEEPA